MAMSHVSFRVQGIVPQLRAYGEEWAVEKLLAVNEDDLFKIGELAFVHYLVPKTILDKAICLGVVEYFEGSSRPLRRKRRVFQKTENSQNDKNSG